MKAILLKLILFYQKNNLVKRQLLKKLFITNASCRFIPTCSKYTYQAFNKYGIIKGFVLSLKRIIRCNPWNKGGNDPLI